MSTYISFFGKSQDFTAKYYNNKGPINDFNQVIKDFNLLESKHFTIDDVKNKEILARYFFKSEGKNYCIVKLYSFAQALNGNRVAGSIFGVGFISDKNINLTKENLALLRDAKLYFAKLSLDEMKFNKSDFSDATDKIWNGIANSKNGNLIDQLQLSKIKFNGNNGVVSFYVKDLFAEAIKLNDRISKQDTVYLSEDLDHLKRTQNKWGKEEFPIYAEENNQYVLYKEQAEVIKGPDQGTGLEDVDVAKLKSNLADSEYNNKILKQDIEKLKKSIKQPSYIIYSLVATIILLLCYIYFNTEKKTVAVAPKIEYIHDTIYQANNSNANSTVIEAEKKRITTALKDYYRKILNINSKDSITIMNSYYQELLRLDYKKFNIKIDSITILYNSKLNSLKP